jgi:hypothetical protein
VIGTKETTDAEKEPVAGAQPSSVLPVIDAERGWIAM